MCLCVGGLRDLDSGDKSMAEETNHQDITSGLESIGLSDDAGQNLKLNQATFFHCVQESNVNTLQVILKHRKIDVNAYNDEVKNPDSQHHSCVFSFSFYFLRGFRLCYVAFVVDITGPFLNFPVLRNTRAVYPCEEIRIRSPV